MIRLRQCFLMVAILVQVSLPATAVELMKWERLPLPVALRVGQERVIYIDKNVRIGLDSSLQQKLRVQSAAGVIYLQAREAIPPSRIQVQVVETGEIILLDIATVPGEAALEPVRIVDEQQSQIVPTEEQQAVQEKQEATSLKIPAPVALTRYAAQNLFAPLRTVEALPGVRTVPLRVQDEIGQILLPLYPVSASALVAYRLGDYYVTAIKISNQGNRQIELDPRELQGRFYAATFQHAWLGAKGHAEDTTVVYLVTQGGGLEQFLFPVAVTDKGAR